MTLEHLSETQLTGYRERSLGPQELLAVDRHLASCDLCHERLGRILPPASLSFESDNGPLHLDYEQLQPYVDGEANDIDREIVESHVAVCSKCAADLEDLREFKQQPVAAHTLRTTPTAKQWLPQWSRRWSLGWAAAIVLAVLIPAVAILMWTRSRSSDTIQQTKTITSDSDGPKVQPSPASTGSLDAPSPEAREEPRLVLNDAGGQVVVNQRGQLEGLQELPPDLKESVERALATRRLGVSPALRGWSAGVNNLRSGLETPGSFGPLDPIGIVIETDRPTFHWQPLEGAQHCTVTVYDSKLRQVASSGPLTRKEWTTPNALERGVTYSWQITALKEGETFLSPKPPLPEARFRVLDQRAFDALAKLKQSAGNSHLAMGVFYWKHGLLDQAEREFQALAVANPNSPAVRELLANIRFLRHR